VGLNGHGHAGHYYRYDAFGSDGDCFGYADFVAFVVGAVVGFFLRVPSTYYSFTLLRD
jgi:hypothetical protein